MELTCPTPYTTTSPTAGFVTTAHDDASATLLCMVNPTNPTGDYLKVDAIKAYIEQNAAPGACQVRLDLLSQMGARRLGYVCSALTRRVT